MRTRLFYFTVGLFWSFFFVLAYHVFLATNPVFIATNPVFVARMCPVTTQLKALRILWALLHTRVCECV